MKTRFIVFLTSISILAAISGCQNNNASIVGNWTLSSFQGSEVTTGPGGSSSLVSYNSNTGILKQTNITSNGSDSSQFTYFMQLNLKNDGTYIDSDSRVVIGSSPVIRTNTDTWTYSPNAPGSMALTINGIEEFTSSSAEVFILTFFGVNPQFEVTYLDAHNLQLTNNWGNTFQASTSTENTTNSFVLKFTR